MPVKTSLYCLNNKHKELTTFVLNDINNRIYFRVSLLRKHYIRDFLNADNETTEKVTHSVSIIITNIMLELVKLGLVEKYNNSRILVWKNPYRNDFIHKLDKLIKNNNLTNKIKISKK